jgi:hypothetical protein
MKKETEMMVQCEACKAYFELSISQDDKDMEPAREWLCNACLLAHIEQLVYGKRKKAHDMDYLEKKMSKQSA